MNKFKTLLRQQKKLIVIFLMTIVLPSLALGTFGILAIKNEKYRLEQQIMDEKGNILTLLKKQFAERFKNTELLLRNTAAPASFGEQDFALIKQQLNLVLTDNHPVDQPFIIFEDGKTFFPLLHSIPGSPVNTGPVLTPGDQNLLRDAQKAEFGSKDYTTAAFIYRELWNKAADYNTAAQMLNNLARTYRKSGDIASAKNTYSLIIERHPAAVTPADLPLALSAEMQLLECNQVTGNNKGALKAAIDLYSSMLDGGWQLNQDQFVLYADMTNAVIRKLIGSAGADSQSIHMRVDFLREKYKTRINQWNERRKIETEIIPLLKEMKQQSIADPVHISKRIQSEDFLITAIPVSGFLCIKWDCRRVIDDWLQPVIANLTAGNQFKIIITDAAGKVLLGGSDQKTDPSPAMGEFDNYFPPWKILVVRAGLTGEPGFNLFASYYFWTVITLLVILVFGTFLILRIINREREVMSIKSSFIASVSHELKTPLTSIRALIERLLAGKVKSPEKMHEYYSAIDRDAGKLSRLVKNILDFSKIEEGKKEYSLEETDITSWLEQIIDDFNNDHIHEQMEIKKNFDPGIPLIRIDRDAVSQCINNLLDNAIKFSPDSKTVEIQLRRDTDFILIEIKDRGVGIMKEDLPKIFDKFFQGSSASRQSVKGVGLGLALVKHAIEAHGGRIEVKSSPGHGSVFLIFLPLKN